MELHEKLQALRKQKGLTQEELAQALYVSRTAISKWESGRGYPSIDSLKALSRFFSVSIDELLTGEEALTLAEETHKEQERDFCSLVFGLLDCGMALFLFLPLFGQTAESAVQAVSLLSLTSVQPYLKAAYAAIIAASTLMGVFLLALKNSRHALWQQHKRTLSLLLHADGVFLFMLSRQPYAAAFSLSFLLMKAWMLLKKR